MGSRDAAPPSSSAPQNSCSAMPAQRRGSGSPHAANATRRRERELDHWMRQAGQADCQHGVERSDQSRQQRAPHPEAAVCAGDHGDQRRVHGKVHQKVSFDAAGHRITSMDNMIGVGRDDLKDNVSAKWDGQSTSADRSPAIRAPFSTRRNDDLVQSTAVRDLRHAGNAWRAGALRRHRQKMSPESTFPCRCRLKRRIFWIFLQNSVRPSAFRGRNAGANARIVWGKGASE